MTTFLDRTNSIELTARPGASSALDELVPSLADVTSVIEHDLTLNPVPIVATEVAAKATTDDEPDAPEHDDTLDIEDSTRLYLREIARVPLLTAEEEVMLAKTMELGLRITRDPALAVVDLHVWTANASEPTARAKHPRYAMPFGDLAARIVRSAIEADDAAEFLVTDRKSVV